MTALPQPEEESVAGQAPTEFSSVGSPERPQLGRNANLHRFVRHCRMTSTVSTKPTLTARAIFNDHSLFFEMLRALGYALYGGSGVGEVVSTAGRIPTATRPPGTCGGGHSPSGFMPDRSAQTAVPSAPGALPASKQPLPTARVLHARRLGE